jgi:chemotaxis protein CheC
MIELTPLEKDALAEAFNVALGAASATFADVVHTEVQMSVPAVDLLTRDQLVARLYALPDNASSRRLVSIAQDFAAGKSIETDAVLLFPQQASLEVVRRMLGDHAAEVQDITELQQDALSEVGNIIINSCMATLADMFGVEFQGSLPQVESSEVEDLVARMHPGDATLLAQISMTMRASNVTGVVLFLMNVPSLESLVGHMRNYFGLDDSGRALT